MSAQINNLAETLKATAKQWEVPVVDFHHLFLNKQGTVKMSLFLDAGVHASKEGHRVMGEHAVELIKNVFHFGSM